MILFKILLLQAMVATVVVLVLWSLLEKELLLNAQERLLRVDPREAEGLGEVEIFTARQVPMIWQQRLRAVIRDKFPEAEPKFVIRKDILGGVIIQAGKILIDVSLVNKLKQLWGDRQK